MSQQTKSTERFIFERVLFGSGLSPVAVNNGKLYTVISWTKGKDDNKPNEGARLYGGRLENSDLQNYIPGEYMSWKDLAYREFSEEVPQTQAIEDKFTLDYILSNSIQIGGSFKVMPENNPFNANYMDTRSLIIPCTMDEMELFTQEDDPFVHKPSDHTPGIIVCIGREGEFDPESPGNSLIIQGGHQMTNEGERRTLGTLIHMYETKGIPGLQLPLHLLKEQFKRAMDAGEIELETTGNELMIRHNHLKWRGLS